MAADLNRSAIDRVHTHWAHFLGVPPEALVTPGTVVVPHAGLAGYRGVWFFVRGSSAVVSTPPDRVDHIARRVGDMGAEDLLSEDAVERIVGRHVGKVVGPSFHGWLAPEHVSPVRAGPTVHHVGAADRPEVDAFRSGCPPADWDHSGIRLKGGALWAAYEGARIVALGQLRSRAPGVVDPCFVTHPEHRGEGHALRVAAALVATGLAQDDLVLYQTLAANVPALAIAKRLGFGEYARLLAVRLTEPNAATPV